jgi:hypothetical protein
MIDDPDETEQDVLEEIDPDLVSYTYSTRGEKKISTDFFNPTYITINIYIYITVLLLLDHIFIFIYFMLQFQLTILVTYC